MFISLYYLLVQFGYMDEFEQVGADLVRFLRTTKRTCRLSWDEIYCMEKIKVYLQEHTNLSDLETIGFIAYLDIPYYLKINQPLRALASEDILEYVTNERKTIININETE